MNQYAPRSSSSSSKPSMYNRNSSHLSRSVNNLETSKRNPSVNKNNKQHLYDIPSQDDIDKLSNLITQVNENQNYSNNQPQLSNVRGSRHTNSTGCIRNEHSKTSSPSINKSKKQSTMK